MLFWTNLWWAFHVRQATPAKLMPFLLFSFEKTCVIPSGCCWNGEWASETRIRPLVQHPASSSIFHPASLCAASHALSPPDTQQFTVNSPLYLTTNQSPLAPFRRQKELVVFSLNNSNLLSSKWPNICQNNPSHRLLRRWDTTETILHGH
jgi:hypothetical protein